MYGRYFKRCLDFCIALGALLVLSPIFALLTVLGFVKMKGNPYFTQLRAGKDEKIFKLIKFRSMTCEKDVNGQLLPDEKRLTRYGKLLRSTSLDELPELINILKGDMSLVGPRPLLVEYLPYYSAEERLRHTVAPGLTGWAQVNGRNNISSWEERFAFDLEYVRRLSLAFDLRILLLTMQKVVKRSDILMGNQLPIGRLDDVRKGMRSHANQHTEVL